jgi:cation diffusion facilitator family transporter
MSSADSKKVVLAALAGNLAIAACKFAAAYLTESTATLAEAVHSVADTGNQGLLLIGMRLALKPPDERFPFGRASERYFWPFVVALMLFSVGGAFAVFEGVRGLAHPEHEDHPLYWSYGVLGISFVFEALSFRVAWGEFKKMAAGKPLREVLFFTRDPTIPLVVAEDATALVGLGIALVAVALGQVTGIKAFDPAGSVVIGLLLAAVAIMIARLTHGLLIGESAHDIDKALALRLTESVPGVQSVTQLLTMHLGPDVVILALKIAFRADMTVAELEDTTNKIEEKIRAEMPHMRKIFIEADSHGDLRGVASVMPGRARKPA